MRLTFRVSLVIAIPLLVVVTGGSIAARTLSSTLESTEALADSLFREVTHETADRAAGQMRGLARILAIVASSIASDPDALETDVLVPRLAAVVETVPEVARASFIGVDGHYVSLHRSAGHPSPLVADIGDVDADGTLRIIERAVGTGGLDASGSVEVAGDPRATTSFRDASATDGRVWVAAHRLAETGALGITCAQRVRSSDGVLGVLMVDVDLESLSSFVQTLDLSPRSRVYLLQADDAVLAHPGHRNDGAHGPVAEGLGGLSSMDDPAARALASELRTLGNGGAGDDGHDDGGDAGIRHLHFEHAGESWLASVYEFSIDEGTAWRVVTLAPERDFLGFVGESVRVSIAITLAALVVAVLLALAFAHRVSRPLDDIASQMQSIGRFELERSSASPSVFEEIAAMQRALDGMKSSLRSFASFVPRDVVRRLVERREQASLGGEQLEVTVFFSDVAGFTTLGERVTPTELVGLLAGYLETMTEEIARNGGTVDKFIGDGIMAFWGAPMPDVDHATHACEAAVRCQLRLDELRRDERHAWLRDARTRIGVATGVALVGNVGTHTRMNYTAMGDVVNLAARLEGLGKSYGSETLVAAATYERARGTVLGRAIDVVAVKGKTTGVRVYEIVGLLDDADDSTRRLCALSESALDAYLARDFVRAIAEYGEILESRSHDVAARTMLARARAFLAAPPPADWTGVHTSEAK